ncbi:hypothetical protein E6C60_2695 [Paenibacillus algicola]|uniref:Uncharacterized protein n=1 Tax=Paenibacillus algicola TaxID=2565926 RepID=A0A4P8XKX8_9BACL|nr:hypothetical protein E6C60_2695 [Paenibacillus algicola]
MKELIEGRVELLQEKETHPNEVLMARHNKKPQILDTGFRSFFVGESKLRSNEIKCSKA